MTRIIGIEWLDNIWAKKNFNILELRIGKIEKIVNDMKTKLQTSLQTNTFFDELQRIDFSKHLGYLIEKNRERPFFLRT